ncbi:MAG TPA: methyltransferase domain-containing protein [Candidatus Solibacter sp.]|nr:methyltransferase domain-containing protein [Candidatus Solibacter sp.]
MDIASLVAEARRFGERLRDVKKRLGDPGFEWYPYETLSALANLDKMLTGANRELFSGRGRVLDLGAQDGELSFLLESLGYQVIAGDHPAYNHNGMHGIHALKAALASRVEIHEIDLDRPFTLPHDTYDLVVMLGVLYHLRNPFYVLEELARRTSHCLLSTRVARCYPDGSPMPAGVSLAYLLAENELNQDNSNYFIFNEAGLRTMLDRAHWEVVDYASLGQTHLSDPVRLDRDERAFCLLRSRYSRLANLELLDGWYDSEDTGWRWTAKEFGVRVRPNGIPRVLEMKVWVAEKSIAQLGVLTLSATANGRALTPAVFGTAGVEMFTRELEGLADGEIEVRFRLDKALPGDASDSRELGVIVAHIRVE